MCAPAALMLAGTAVGAAAQYRQGKFDQKVALNNATIADYQRRDVIQRGAADAARVEAEGRRFASDARTNIAAGNVEGTALDKAVLESSYNAALDAARLRANAARAAWGLKNEEDELRARARDAKEAGFLGAFGTSLSGGAQAASMYASRKG